CSPERMLLRSESGSISRDATMPFRNAPRRDRLLRFRHTFLSVIREERQTLSIARSQRFHPTSLQHHRVPLLFIHRRQILLPPVSACRSKKPDARQGLREERSAQSTLR